MYSQIVDCSQVEYACRYSHVLVACLKFSRDLIFLISTGREFHSTDVGENVRMKKLKNTDYWPL